MWLTGLDRVRRFVNRAYVDFLDVGYERALTFDWRTILHPDDHDRIVAESIAGEASLKPFTLDARYRRNDGQWRWMHSISQPSFDAAGEHNGFIGVVFDLTDTKRAEAALRQSAAEFEALAENVSQLAWMADSDGSIFWYNRRWYEYTGTDLKSMEDRGWRKVHHPDRIDEIIEELGANWAAGVPWEGTYLLRSAEGEYRWFLTRAEPIRNEAGELLRWFGTNTDIHAQVEAEEALSVARKAAEAEAAERTAILGQLGEGVIVADADGRITYVNEMARTLHGVAELDVEPSDYSETYHLCREDGSPYPFEELPLARAVMKGETVRDARWRIRRPDGTEVLAIGSAQPIRSVEGVQLGSVLTLRDDSERHAAYQALHELNRTLETKIAERTRERDAMWRLSRDLLLVLDTRLRIVSVNPIIMELTGYTAEEVVGQSFVRFLHPDDRPLLAQAIRRGRRERITDLDARLVTREGEVRQFVWNETPEAGLAYVSGRDVTDERARLGELFAAQEALRQAQKLEAIGQLTGGVAHDFNNLLSPIIGGLDILRRRNVGGEREQRLIDGALQSAERAKVLVQRLLAFARRQPLQVRAVSLAPLLEDLRGLLASTLGPQIELSITVEPGLDPVMADANQLEMAILNLAVNARDAMPDGGWLRVTAEHVVASTGAALIELAVSDEGLGMDEETLARATEPFFSSKGLGKGTGLGLSMVEGLTAQLGGSLHITSRPGGGTTVTLCLPIASPTTARPTAATSPAAAPGRGRILLVDDEPLVRLGTAEMLRDEGYDVEEADSAEAALTMGPFDRYDCVVTDYLMPGMNGVELADLLNAEHPSLPILLLSGYADLEAFSALPYVSKPCFGDDLTRAIAELMVSAG